MLIYFFFSFISSTEYFVKWKGDNKTVCHPLWPCSWEIAVTLFEREDIIQITDPELNTVEQLLMLQNMTKYALEIGGGIASNVNTKIDGAEFQQNHTDFYIEISPFNESLLFGFQFYNFHHPILSARGMDLFLIVNCSFYDNHISYDFPLISFCNVTVIMANTTIENNSVEGTSILGLSTSILGYFNSTIENNIQLSRGPVPLFEFTNGASEITNSTIRNNISPNSPLIGSWFFIIVIITNSTIEHNFCGSSALFVGDSLANLTLSNSTIKNNRAALLHSMTMSSVNLSNTKFINNYAAGQSLIFAPRSTIQFLNDTIVADNVADSILSSQLSNETSLNLISTYFLNNTCSDTAFALSNSESKIEGTKIKTNTIIDHPLISVCSSNFSINSSSFDSNWIMRTGNLIEVEDGSIDVNISSFKHNIGEKTGAFLVSLEANETFSFVFRETNFLENEGNIVDSIYFEKKIPPAQFEYCKFSKLRFEEVNGDFYSNQLFHRCRFEKNQDEKEKNEKISFKINQEIEKKRRRYNNIFFDILIVYLFTLLICFAVCFNSSIEKQEPLI
ncbi:hypothetical protein M9Y10_043768 [Tritrichomonas musculus]|uniref:Right handed beta helix domain-containing protein n=1 Tax=Tritrichomonas musculus TaxID=1915356 RepID=A0ABR2K0M2_9EUKA